ncbi:hypothetical protein N9L20_08350 [Flavobacteriaceae bacterium]|nr:hypothetical protein [Flavobacteriaceae bacterium]
MTKNILIGFSLCLISFFSYGQKSLHGIGASYFTTFTITPNQAIESDSRLNGVNLEYSYNLNDKISLLAVGSFGFFEKLNLPNPEFDFDKTFSGDQFTINTGIQTRGCFGGSAMLVLGSKNSTYYGFSNLSNSSMNPQPVTQTESSFIYGANVGVFYNLELTERFSFELDVFYQFQNEIENLYGTAGLSMIGASLSLKYKFIPRSAYFFIE